MDEPDQPEQAPPSKSEGRQRRTKEDLDARWARIDKRRAKIRAEIERNREGGHRVPTWVLAAILVVVLAVWIFLIVTG
jgi:hypothetical protein